MQQKLDSFLDDLGLLNSKKENAKHKYTCCDCGKEIYTLRVLKRSDHKFHIICRNKVNGGKLNHELLR